MTSNNDLFDNPMVNKARDALTDEDKDRYQKMGEDMYNTVDFTTSVVNSEVEPGIERFAYISLALRSGENPASLDENDINILISVYGDKWYTEFNYTLDDMAMFAEIK